ncbi:MAG: hypothetical protein R3E79_37855 [Caldilineaceae bacterium]
MMLLDVSLDTSFWNAASKIGVAPYVFSFFRVHYCQAVRNEIITTDPNETPLVYPQAMLFLVFEEDGRFQHQEPVKPLKVFGSGEAHALALAYERNWTLLINDSRPFFFAQSLGVSCVSVPDFCVLLYAHGKITLAAARGYLARLSPVTSMAFIEQADEVITELARKKGENGASK